MAVNGFFACFGMMPNFWLIFVIMLLMIGGVIQLKSFLTRLVFLRRDGGFFAMLIFMWGFCVFDKIRYIGKIIFAHRIDYSRTDLISLPQLVDLTLLLLQVFAYLTQQVLIYFSFMGLLTNKIAIISMDTSIYKTSLDILYSVLGNPSKALGLDTEALLLATAYFGRKNDGNLADLFFTSKVYVLVYV